MPVSSGKDNATGRFRTWKNRHLRRVGAAGTRRGAPSRSGPTARCWWEDRFGIASAADRDRSTRLVQNDGHSLTSASW